MNETIAAITTPLGLGGVAIIRISGSEAIEEINKIFKGKDLTKVASHTLNYGHIVYSNQLIDEVLIGVMKNPHSYTGEDIVEINCHGGIYLTNKILEIVLENPFIRLAEPGEFTKRAFLNGKKSLLAAKASNDLINAKTEVARTIAMSNLSEQTSDLIAKLREQLLTIIAQIEVNIDYPEYQDIEEYSGQIIGDQINQFLIDIDQIIIDSMKGELYTNGIKTAIIGAPNVGKSTLLNQLSRFEKAIVTEIAGTTRDVIESEVNLGNIVLHLYDTAGIRETEDVVESIGVQKSIELIDSVALILFIIDSTRPLTEDEEMLLKRISNKNHLILANKADHEEANYLVNDALVISAKTGLNIGEIEKQIIDKFDLANFNALNARVLSSTQDLAKLRRVRSNIASANEQIQAHMPIDIIEIDLKEALFSLGEILGIQAQENLLDELFSRFCLGK